jgi:hypothetical protein
MLGTYHEISCSYRTDVMREVARRVRTSDLESTRLRGALLSFSDSIAQIRSTIDDERSRL